MENLKCWTIVLAVFFFMSCSDKKKDNIVRPVKVEVQVVSDAGSGISDEYVGTVEEITGVSLSFEVPGNVRSIKVNEGDRVAKGQLLATIDPITLREAHRATLVTLRQARDAYKRFKSLHAHGTISDIQWVDVQTKLEQAEAAEMAARQQLSHTSLHAPFGGVISSKNVEVGANVLPGQQVLKLVSIGQVNVKLSVPEAEISNIKIGQNVDFSVQALGGQQFSGIVTEKGVEANPISHTYDVKVKVSNTRNKLMPGMVCNASIRISESASTESSGLIVLPPNCVELDVDNSRFVWLVSQGKAIKRSVVIGGFVGDKISIVSGLSVGDRVIVGGHQKVSEGMRVKE